MMESENWLNDEMTKMLGNYPELNQGISERLLELLNNEFQYRIVTPNNRTKFAKELINLLGSKQEGNTRSEV